MVVCVLLFDYMAAVARYKILMFSDVILKWNSTSSYLVKGKYTLFSLSEIIGKTFLYLNNK